MPSFRSLWALALAPACAPSTHHESQAPVCSTTVPGETALAPELSDSGRIYRGTLSPDGRELWFFKKVTDDPEQEDYRIYSSHRTDKGWSAAERVDLGGEFSDLYPTLSHDGQRLAFTSYRPFPGDTSAHPSANLWYADRRGDRWSTPVPITSVVQPGYYHSQVWFGPGDSLIFRATTPDWESTTTLVTVWSGSAYAAPVPYEPVERWAGWRPDLYVWGGVPGPRGSVVLEVSALAEDGRRRGPTDLWMAQRDDGRWTEPRPLGGGVNTPGNETFPAVTADGCALVFVRDFSSVHLVTLAAAAPPP
jgi:WD40-like Beta Propeller Repeat